MTSSPATEQRLYNTQTYSRYGHTHAKKHTHRVQDGGDVSTSWTQERGCSGPSFPPQTAGSSAGEINYLDTPEFNLFTSAKLFTEQTTGVLYNFTSWSLCGSFIRDYNQIFRFNHHPLKYTTSGYGFKVKETLQSGSQIPFVDLRCLQTIPIKQRQKQYKILIIGLASWI